MMPRSSDQLLLPVNPWFMWTTLVGALLFRERLSRLNLLGVLLALGAIVALMPR